MYHIHIIPSASCLVPGRVGGLRVEMLPVAEIPVARHEPHALGLGRAVGLGATTVSVIQHPERRASAAVARHHDLAFVPGSPRIWLRVCETRKGLRRQSIVESIYR